MVSLESMYCSKEESLHVIGKPCKHRLSQTLSRAAVNKYRVITLQVDVPENGAQNYRGGGGGVLLPPQANPDCNTVYN